MTIQEYFKDKIDWKFYNALLSSIVRFEDKSDDCIIQLYIEIITEDMSHINIYKYYNGKTNYVATNYNFDYVKKKYLKNGLTYTVVLSNDDAGEFKDRFNCDRLGYFLWLDGDYKQTHTLYYRKDSSK